MVSITKVELPESGTQAEIDALPIASLPLGTRIFNETTGKYNINLDNANWTVDTFPSGANLILHNDSSGNVTTTPNFSFDGSTYVLTGDNLFVSLSDSIANILQTYSYSRYNNTASSGLEETIFRSRGTFFTPLPNLNGDLVKITKYDASDSGSLQKTGATFEVNVDGVVSGTAVPMSGKFRAFNDDTSTESYWQFNSDGSMILTNAVNNQMSFGGTGSATFIGLGGMNMSYGNTISLETPKLELFRSSGNLDFSFHDSSQAFNEKMWSYRTNGSDLEFATILDNSVVGDIFFNVTRNQGSVQTLTLAGNNNTFSFTGNGTASVIGGSQFTINYGDEIELTTFVLDFNADRINFSGDRVNYDGAVVSASYAPANTLRVIADEAISIGDVLTASTLTDFRVVKVKETDPDSIGVIGFAETAAAGAGVEFLMTGGGIFTVSSDGGSVFSAGDPVEKSDATDGKVQNTVASVGTFGIAAQDAAINTLFKAWRRINESF